MKKAKNKVQRLGLALLIFILGMNATWAQKTVSINKNSVVSTQEQRIKSVSGEFSRSRAFEANPQLQDFSQNNVGDTLLLDFFGDKRYKAVVRQVSKSYDGVTGIALQIADSELAYCYISVQGEKVAVSAEIPQQNEYFSIQKTGGKNCLTMQKLSDIQKDTDTECHTFESEHSAAHTQNRSLLPRAVQAAPPSDDAVTIDLLVSYTPSARQWAETNGGGIDVEISNAVTASNLAFANSQTNITLNVVYKYEVNYNESGSANTDLNRMRNTDDGFMDEIHVLRRQYNADIVTLLGNQIGTGGVGYVLNDENGNPLNAFSVVKIAQATSSYSLVHEIAHNMGCGHHQQVDGNHLYPYSTGWRGQTSNGSKYSSVMTYQIHPNYTVEPNVSYTRIPYFSSPSIDVDGTTIGDAYTDNTQTLKQTKKLVADYSNPDGELDCMDNFLSNIQISEGTLMPAFRPEIKQYSVSVGDNVQSIDIIGTPNYWAASVYGNGNAALQLGDNVITLEVENAWGNGPSRYYNITITRSSGTTINIDNISDAIGINICPNPVVDELRIENGKLKVGDKIEIFDVAGKLQKSSFVHNAQCTTVNVSALSKGVYMLKAGDFAGKFVK